jgi:AraC family transcriptional regulator
MQWIERLNESITYMEEHITEEIDYERLAKIACCSSYHFQRMFAYIANVPLAEYIRRRRMTLAAADLQRGQGKVIDIAMKYGYASPTAFNRAFQKIHGIAPSLAQQDGASFKSFPPIRFMINIKGAEELNFSIKNKNAFRIVGVTQPIDNDFENNSKIVPQMWQKMEKNGTILELAAMMDNSFPGILGVSITENFREWKYLIGVVSKKEIGSSLTEFIPPSCTWAVFSAKGNSGIGILELEKRIITEWFPSFDYAYNNGPNIAIERFPVSHFDCLQKGKAAGSSKQNHEFEVWIPIIKKRKP